MRARLIPIGAVLAVLVTVGVAARVAVEREQTSGRSEIIAEPWDRLQGRLWLKPNLERAQVVVPDRPHNHDEVRASRAGESSFGRVRTFAVSTGSMRLRGGDPGPKAEGVVRIVAIGDSVTHGWGVPFEASYPAQLEGELGRRGIRAEVINAGVPANAIDTMRVWCEQIGPDLQPDVVLWTRRPEGGDPPPYAQYTHAVQRCAAATRAQALAVLPPISSFDPHGRQVWQKEQQSLRQVLGPAGVEVVELTPHFDQARQGRGEALVFDGPTLRVVDQETSREWIAVPREQGPDLPAALLELFEDEPEVREALFFDNGHPDAEGFALFARVLADTLEPRLRSR